MTATDAIAIGDTVEVSFAEAGGTKTASQINIRRKAGKTE
jgi:hypothetical protein